MTDSAANELVGTQATINARPFQAIRTPSAAPATAIDQCFGQELLHDADSCSAKGRPHRKFLLAVRTTDEQQDRYVGTADQQQRRDRTQQQKEPWAHRPREQFDDAAELNAKRVGVAARCLCGELLQDGLQFGIGLCDGHARADLERHAVVDVGLEPDLERHVNVRFAPAKSRRHDADDLIVLANELQGPADHGRVARVIPLPELIAQHHDARRVLTRRSVSRNQPSPHQRGIAPMIWRVRSDVRRRHIFGDIAIGRREVPPILRDDALDSAGLSKLFDLRATHARPAEASGWVHERDLHDPLGAHVREGIEEDAIDDAEHRARGADAECQRENCREREPGPPAQFTSRVAKIGEDRLHVVSLDVGRASGVY